MNNPRKDKNKETRRAFLLSFFNPPHNSYAYVIVNNFILVRQYDGNNNSWHVAIWDKETWDRVHNQHALF